MDARHGQQSLNTAKGRLRKIRESRLGQISLLIVFSLIPMFSLFAFSVNIGVLVNDKIALQSATDLAAYAGAAAQARQLTNISHLNYYMRMIYKKFLYKYYILGNVSLRCFPGRTDQSQYCGGAPTGSSKFNWINPLTANDAGAPGTAGNFPGVPVVCMSLSPGSNPCQVATAVHVVQPVPCNAIDPTCGALNAASANIATAQTAACLKSSIVNQKVLGLWLFATNFAAQRSGVDILDGLVNNDIGLITEEELTLQRIMNIKAAINAPAQTSVTQALASTLATHGGSDVSGVERTVLAFGTLINGIAAGGDNPIIDPSTVTMVELLPSTPMLDLTPIQIPVQAGISFMAPDPNNGNSCTMRIGSIEATGSGTGAGNFLNVGVQKNGSSVVYYAIQASAQAKLLFNPFPFGHPADTIQLTAYAAAKPFGSRIGPIFSGTAAMISEFTDQGTPHDGDGQDADIATKPFRFPSLVMDYAGDSTQSAGVLKAIYDAVQDSVHAGPVFVACNGSNCASQNAGLLALVNQIAILPDIAELGRYNIPVDAERGQGYFYPYYSSAGSPTFTNTYTMWAPFDTPATNQAFKNNMDTLVEQISSNAANAAVASGSQLGASVQALKQELKTDAENGVAAFLLSGGLITTQGSDVFKMPDPLGQAYWGTGNHIVCPTKIPGKICPPTSGTPNPGGGGVWSQLATSFPTPNDPQYNKAGRDGFSVKLISFQDLLSGDSLIGSASGSQTNWQPPSIAGPAGATEVGVLMH